MKTRIIAAVALLPLLLIIVLAAPKVLTAVLVGVLAAIAAFELLAGTGHIKQAGLIICCAAMAILVALHSYFNVDAVVAKLALVIFWVLIFVEIMASGMTVPFEKAAICFVAGILVPYFLSALIRIHIGEYGRWFVLVPFILAFLSDTGAYFAGRAFGKNQLAPKISPKKTIEGAFGGVAGAILGMLLFCVILRSFFSFEVNYVYALIYGIIGSAASVFGDLCFSVIKRQAGIKDYGNLIPGHGGVLDRFDSMVVVAPLCEVLLIIFPLAVKI